VYLLEHSLQGALGVIVNHPLNMRLADIVDLLEEDVVMSKEFLQTPIYLGGPITQQNRGFILHESGYRYEGTVSFGDVSVTTSRDIMVDLARGAGPNKFLILLGCAMWYPEQLEKEIAANLWLSYPANSELLFDVPPEIKFNKILDNLGINLGSFDFHIGHA